ncbi:MAG: OsmC family protein [Planctomycetota bacterium]
MVKIAGRYTGQLGCEATHTPSGKILVTDAPLDNGGRGESFSPTDLVATGLGTCVMTICGLMANRHDWNLDGMTVEVEKIMVASPTRRIGGLPTVVTIPASAVTDESDRKKLEAAARKCPVHASLHPEIDAPIDFRWV